MIDKVIVPSDRELGEKDHKTIYVPIRNEITKDALSLEPLRFYAKRSKLYAAFSKFCYQEHELANLTFGLKFTPIEELSKSTEMKTIRHFLATVRRYDFWETTDIWKPIRIAYCGLQTIERLLDQVIATGTLTREDLPNANFPENFHADDEEYLLYLLGYEINAVWGRLKNLNNMYEEICRECFLPTYMGNQLS